MPDLIKKIVGGVEPFIFWEHYAILCISDSSTVLLWRTITLVKAQKYIKCMLFSCTWNNIFRVLRLFLLEFFFLTPALYDVTKGRISLFSRQSMSTTASVGFWNRSLWLRLGFYPGGRASISYWVFSICYQDDSKDMWAVSLFFQCHQINECICFFLQGNSSCKAVLWKRPSVLLDLQKDWSWISTLIPVQSLKAEKKKRSVSLNITMRQSQLLWVKENDGIIVSFSWLQTFSDSVCISFHFAPIECMSVSRKTYKGSQWLRLT